MESNARMVVPEEQVVTDLGKFGFQPQEVRGALSWIERLQHAVNKKHYAKVKHGGLRCFCLYEQKLLGIDGVSFLYSLEQAKLIDLAMREIIIDQAMALGHDKISLIRLKWVSLMVLYMCTTDRESLLWAQDFILNNVDVRH